ncbi:PREDICTED: uncharacterized protein LOC102021999, partial [Chinchilla lanigera]|uniref:uncharacterized protein LOC102021999 n=1 Tax=Chinchilla lanigera TaxID=34839 RepID=UPI000695E41E
GGPRGRGLAEARAARGRRGGTAGPRAAGAGRRRPEPGAARAASLAAGQRRVRPDDAPRPAARRCGGGCRRTWGAARKASRAQPLQSDLSVGRLCSGRKCHLMETCTPGEEYTPPSQI